MVSLSFLAVALAQASAPPLECVVFGGGPARSSNQIAIESNVRYVRDLVPQGTRQRTLFADGNPASKTVQFESKTSATARLIQFLFGAGPSAGPPLLEYRPTLLKAVDAPLTAEQINTTFSTLKASESKTPLLLYFTGHGSPGLQTSAALNPYDNNVFDLWKGETLSTKQLSRYVQQLPKDRPVTLLMVQCFSGSFGNVLFQEGNPTGAYIPNKLCGFFATTKEREAAGCTPEVREENYRDFTTYFVAALTGKSRLGKKHEQPDYDGDGKTGMSEAFAWTLIHEDSIDVPVCTSDVFLRRFVPVQSDAEIAVVPWAEVLASARPSQKAALLGLCNILGQEAQTDDRLKTAFGRVNRPAITANYAPSMTPQSLQEYQRWRKTLGEEFPALRARRPSDADWQEAIRSAEEKFESNPEQAKAIGELLSALEKASATSLMNDATNARWLRLARLAKSVVLEKRLRATKDKARIQQLDDLLALEASNPFQSK